MKTGIVPVESYEIYQYGFQIGLEMLFSFVVCFGVATYLHMIPEFVVYTGIFMLLRTYAGVPLPNNSYNSCNKQIKIRYRNNTRQRILN